MAAGPWASMRVNVNRGTADRGDAPADSARPSADSSRPPALEAVTPASGSINRAPSHAGCPVHRGDIRLTEDTIGGLATRQMVGALWQLCPSARADTVGVGGSSVLALRIDTPGATLWAIQYAHDASGDSLHRDEPATFWAAEGDSLRFPDAQLIPTRVGAIRALDSLGAIVVDHGDDGSGSYIVICKYPALAMIINNQWPPFARSGVVPLALASIRDTTSIWRVEVGASRLHPAVKQACAKRR